MIRSVAMAMLFAILTFTVSGFAGSASAGPGQGEVFSPH